MKSVIKGASYILAHTPDMVLHNGTTQTTERIVNPESEYLKELPNHLRSYEQVLAYYPNQVYIGNKTPEDLAAVAQPWYDKTCDVSDRYGKFGEIMPQEEADIRLFNQSVMELGATVCGPNGAPKCDLCPMAELCLARRNGTADVLPVKKPKKQRRIEEKTVFVLLRDGTAALRQREESGLLAGLWEFPNVEGTLTEETAPAVLQAWGLTAKNWNRKLTAKHIFTHVEWRMTGYVLEVSGEGPEDFLWVDEEGLTEHAVPSAFVRYYTEAQEHLRKGN